MNSDDNVNHGGVVTRTVAAMLTMSGLFVGARLYTRLVLLKRGGVDDLLVGLAWIFNCLSGGFACAQVQHGLGRHQDTVPLEDLKKVLKFLFFSILTYNISLTLTKIAVLALYLRLIIDQRMKIILYCMMGVVILYGVETFITGTVTCTPVRHFWDLEPGTCLDKPKLWIANASINMATDFIIFFLPLPVIFTMIMSMRQRLLLALVFGIGFCVCVISLLRLKTLTAAGESTDYTWDGIQSAVWSSTELSTAILCACLTTLRPLLALITPKILTTSPSKRSGDGQDNLPIEQPFVNTPSEPATNTETGDEKYMDYSFAELQESSGPPYRSKNREAV